MPDAGLHGRPLFDFGAEYFLGPAATAAAAATRLEMLDRQGSVQIAEAELERVLREEVAPQLPMPGPLVRYKAVAQEEYLVEVPDRLVQQVTPVHAASRANRYSGADSRVVLRTIISIMATSDVYVPRHWQGRVPRNWRKVNATKAHGRFRPPVVEQLLQKLNERRDELRAATEAGWTRFLADVSARHYGVWAKLVATAGTLDALLSLAALAQLPGYCRPAILTEPVGGGPLLRVVGARHPVVEALLPTGDAFVPNGVELGYGSSPASWAVEQP
jgi:hypothetical protein